MDAKIGVDRTENEPSWKLVHVPTIALVLPVDRSSRRRFSQSTPQFAMQHHGGLARRVLVRENELQHLPLVCEKISEDFHGSVPAIKSVLKERYFYSFEK